jgi:hypothetical protein
MFEEYYLCAVEAAIETVTGRTKFEKRNVYYACTDFNLYEFFSEAKKILGYRGKNVRLTVLSRITVTRKEYEHNTPKKIEENYNRSVDDQHEHIGHLY